MYTGLNELVEVSHYYGCNPNYVIAGGGNTSYKNENYLWIKASGTSLASIAINELVCLNRDGLKNISKKVYNNNVQQRELEVKNDLNSCIVSNNGKRPSVETSLHEIIGYNYVVHTHPTLVNAIMCSNNAKNVIEKLFGNKALFIEYTDPGYILFKEVSKQIAEYTLKNNIEPNIIFLENHGVFVGANTIGEIKQIYEYIEATINSEIKKSLPDITPIPNNLNIVSNSISNKLNKVALAFNSKLIECFTINSASFNIVSKPATPDVIVYCKSKYLFVEDVTHIEKLIVKFENENNYTPRVIVVKNSGIIIIEDSEKTVNNVFDVFNDMLKICFLSENFGGYKPMNDNQIAFIDNWEVENYRRMMSKAL